MEENKIENKEVENLEDTNTEETTEKEVKDEEVEVEEEVVEEQNEQPQQTEKKSKFDTKTIMMILAGIVVVIMMIFRGVNGTDSDNGTCEVIPQSPWGQSQGPVWVETKTPAETRAITSFELEAPESIATYTTRTFRAYTKQIYEVRYLDENGDIGAQIDKAYICGYDVYEYVYNDSTEYRSITKEEVGDLTVTFKGDGETVSVATWVDGEYSYAIASWSTPLSFEEMTDLIATVK